MIDLRENAHAKRSSETERKLRNITPWSHMFLNDHRRRVRLGALHGRKYQHFLFPYSEKSEVVALKTQK
jgi:hypothetical protein